MELNGIADRIEALLKGRALDGYEIYLSASKNLGIEVREQKVDAFKCSAPVGVSIRVLKARGMGFSYSTSLDVRDLERMIDSALQSAEIQTPDEFNGLPSPRPYPLLTGLFDEELVLIGEREKIERALLLEKLTQAADPRIKKVRKASYNESSFDLHIRNSLGVACSYRDTSVSASVTAIAEEGGDSQMGWDFAFSNNFSGIDVERIAKTAAGKAAALLGAGKGPTMRCPAVLDNRVAGEILEVLSQAFLAESVQKGKSLLAGKLGMELFSPVLRIRDDGTLPGGMGTAPFDGEGSPQQNNVLVENGRLLRFLYDGYCARKDGTASTGNATRGSCKNPPRAGVTNFFIENGATTPEGLTSGIDRGILITEVMGMHTANAISGDFSVGAAGFLIERGAVTVPVKGIAISGNIMDIFRGVDLVGNDLRFYGAVGSPSLRIAALDIAGK
ncbi:MAG TPA: TldD/PmbA family protein [Geobacteraceae bacterium]|nr:TldD/PmbA family protein [Geobacteraceae bacterium]